MGVWLPVAFTSNLVSNLGRIKNNGKILSIYLYVNYINGIEHDNQAINLERITPKENAERWHYEDYIKQNSNEEWREIIDAGYTVFTAWWRFKVHAESIVGNICKYNALALHGWISELLQYNVMNRLQPRKLFFLSKDSTYMTMFKVK
ncbi:860_t:CDS:2 [Funneliformis caledonium]|uniref:860_t:CDS:1 n=1 Tax=Funneliformis caledonium TaxID=1117310 RepID=A0A9N9CAF2_9GLOM|nr:860_t:CDS:2 [Funneliformis caledonium]